MNQYFSRMLIVQTLQFFIILIMFAFLGDFEGFYSKAENYFIILSSYLLFLGFGFFTMLFRPLKIEITQESPLNSQLDSTVILVRNNTLQTVQDQRTVKLKIAIKRKKSIWWKLTVFLIEKLEIKIIVITNPNDLIIRAFNRLELKELSNNYEGFKIDIKPLIIQLSKQKNELETSKTYSYFIQGNPDQYISDELNAVIEPIIEYKSSLKSRFISRFLVKRLIGFKTGHHKVFYKNKN